MRCVVYSRTEDNPFIDPIYVSQLKKDMPFKEQERLLKGRWVSIRGGVIYYEYDKDRNYADYDYQVDLSHPVWISWDFNIGHGKPMSNSVSQFIDDFDHIFGEAIIDGSNTWQSCEELAAKDYLEYKTKYLITGDATGRHMDTRSNLHDYDIIDEFFRTYRTRDGRRLNYEIVTPLSNPQVRQRHRVVNAYCRNALAEVRLRVYKGAPTVHKGLMHTTAKKGATLVEDDSKRYQHVSTTVGYKLVCAIERLKRRGTSSRVF